MKKTLLCTALSSLLCFAVHAEGAEQPTTTSTPPAPSTQAIEEPATAASPSLPSTVQTLPVINCEYAIPATTTTIEQSIISTWAKNAAIQSFDFNPTAMSAQLDKLKNCFTEQGWQGYYDALVKSGNLESIKTHGLTVSSKVDGDIKIDPVKENQWKITLPMTVNYQNDKESFKQELSVDLLISRKVSGDLGIMQVIASPKQAASTQTPAPAAEETAH